MQPRLLTLLMLGCACASPWVEARAGLEPVSVQPAPQREGALLAAHHSLDASSASPAEARRDEVVVVFRERVDPSTLTPESFLLTLEDGRRVVPVRAGLDPAVEADEHRSVRLTGDFGDAGRNVVDRIEVVGRVYGVDGERLEGLSGEVRGFEEPDAIVWVERLGLPDPACEGMQLVRTYWTDLLRDVSEEDLTRVELSFVDGTRAAPTRVADHASFGEDSDAGDDNVLDFCVASSVPAAEIIVPEGLFEDRAGHPTAAARARVPQQLELLQAAEGAD